VLVAPLVAKIIGLYDHDPARLRKSTLDELPTLAQFAALMAFLALVSSPIIFAGILGPREAIALFVVVLVALTAGRVVARRTGSRLVSPERCLFIGPADEAARWGRSSRTITPRMPGWWPRSSSMMPRPGRHPRLTAPSPTPGTSSAGSRSGE
jgi:hypothetical protein